MLQCGHHIKKVCHISLHIEIVSFQINCIQGGAREAFSYLKNSMNFWQYIRIYFKIKTDEDKRPKQVFFFLKHLLTSRIFQMVRSN